MSNAIIVEKLSGLISNETFRAANKAPAIKSQIFIEALKMIRWLFANEDEILAVKNPPGKWNIVFWYRYGQASFRQNDRILTFRDEARRILEEMRES